MNLNVTALSYETIKITKNTFKLRWFDPLFSLNNWQYNVYIDGILVDSTTDNNSLLNISSGEHQIYVIRTNLGTDMANSGIGFCPSWGRKIKISWSKCTDTTFQSYLVYYKKNASAVWLLMDKINDINILSAFSPELLENISYDFKLEFMDSLGNTSSYNVPYSDEINKLPLPVSLSVSINADVSGSMPNENYVVILGIKPTQTEIAQYELYSNFDPIYSQDLLDGFANDAIKTFNPGDVLAYQYQIFPGNWKFCFYSTDYEGLKSQSNIVELSIDDTFAEGDTFPGQPVTVYAEQIATGIKITSTTDNTLNKTNTVFGIIDPSGNVTEYSIPFSTFKQWHSFTGLTNGISYQVYTYYMNNAQIGNKTYGNDITVDSSAPTGDYALQLEIVK